MPGAVQSQDLAIVGFGTVGSYFLVTGTALSWYGLMASSPCLVVSMLGVLLQPVVQAFRCFFRVAPYTTQHAERLHTAGIVVASAVPFKAGLTHVTCNKPGVVSSAQFRQAWPLLVCAGIFTNGAAAASARHGGMQNVSNARWPDDVA